MNIYLENALTIIRSQAYLSQPLNWEHIFTQANTIQTQTPAECYPFIRDVLSQVGGVLVVPGANTNPALTSPMRYGLRVLSPEFIVSEVWPGQPADRAGIQTGDQVELIDGQPLQPSGKRVLDFKTNEPLRFRLRRADNIFEAVLSPEPLTGAPLPYGHYRGVGIGYIELFLQVYEHQRQAYIDAVQAAIREGHQAGARAWVIDLRRNRGGNDWAMLTGCGPLLGAGVIMYVMEKGGDKTTAFYRTGSTAYQETGMNAPEILYTASQPFHVPGLDQVPLALLTSSLTECGMTLMAFRSRPNTRSFGEVTNAYPHGLSPQRLEDGTLMLLPDSIFVDRSGNKSEGVITPDEQVELDWQSYGKETDPVLRAATNWLMSMMG